MAKKVRLNLTHRSFPKEQLWVVEKRVTGHEIRRIYVFAMRWFDVRETACRKLNTIDTTELFISAVMGTVKPYTEDVEAIYSIEWTGSAANENTLRKEVHLLWGNLALDWSHEEGFE